MKKLGDIWEVYAIQYLQKHNYSIKTTNFKFWRFWEIDVIAEKEGRYYFIEVKYRSHTAYGLPEESITPYKLRKCRKTVEYYCMRNNIDFENIQFDVITFLRKQDSYKVTHYKNIEI